jgi:uncharacterized protein YlxW (UPF0749 family)
VVIVGLLVGLAVSSQRKLTPEVGAARNALAGDAVQRSQQVKELESTLAETQRTVNGLQQRRLQSTAVGQQLAQQQAALTLAAAQTAEQGPGVRVSVADVATTRSGTAGSRPQGLTAGRTGRVADQDLQAVVNALWAGGAEAISVGGIRLGPQTTIRTAGQTILVDYRPVRSPYVIAAIGGPQLIGAVSGSPVVSGLRAGPAGTHPDVSIRPEPSLRLPAASSAQSRTGQPLTTGAHS